MAGFGTTMSKLIEDDREYYRELATKKRDYLQTYGTKAVLDRDEKANGALSVFNSLVTAGIPEEDLRYVLDTTGVPGLAQLSSTLSSRSDLTKSEIAGLVKKSKDYVAENPDEDISTVLRRAYGLYKSADNPVDTETNLFSAVLGLDSRMMEREALNDVYIDGFKGTDLYAIMARGGPKPGEALSLNLPTKPPSTSEIKLGYDSLQNRFEQTIDAKIKALTQSQSDDNTDVEADRIVADIKALNDLKGRGVLGYAKLGEIDPTFMDYAKSLEETRPGIITRNPTMIEFGSAYTTYWGDQEDDAKLDSAPNGGGTPPGPAPEDETPNSYTPTELRAALGSGELTANTKVVVNGKEVVITQEQVDQGKSEAPSLTDDDMGLPDGPVNRGLTDDDMGLPDSPVIDTIAPAISSGAATSEWIDSLGLQLPSTEDLNTSIVSNLKTTNSAVASGLATAVDFLTGFVGGSQETRLSRGLKNISKRQADSAAKVAAMGFTKYFTSDLPPKEVVDEVEDNFVKLFTTATDTPAYKQLEELIRERMEYAEKKKAEEPSAVNEVFTPEFPGNVPEDLENATTSEISKALSYLTELPDVIHQSLFDTQDKINASIASLFEETLEERIMKNSAEGYSNRVVALQALKDKISDLRKEDEVEQTVEPEPLVTRPKKPLKPKGMTASDKARLQRAQKADELSGDSGLLEMLVKKYGIALVQKEMGL